MATMEIIEKNQFQLDVVRFLALGRRRWKTIAAVTVLCTAAALVYGQFATRVYRATAKLIIDPRQQKILTAEEVLPGLASDASAIETQVELLTSTRIALRVLHEMTAGEAAAPANDHDVRLFLSHLAVARKGLTYVVDVSYSAPEAVQAADIANRVAQAYIAEEEQSIREITERANEWLKERIKTVGPELMTLEKTILTANGAQGFIAIGEQNVAEREIIDYMAQLGMARAAMAEAEAKLELDKSKSSISLQSQDDFEIAKTKVALMERGLRTLTKQLIDHRMEAINEQDVERDAVATRSLYDSLLKRQRETEVQQNLATVNARIVQEALPPAYPIWPRRSLLVLAGFFFGMTLGVFIVVAAAIFSRDGWDDIERGSS